MNLKTNTVALALCALLFSCNSKNKEDNYDYKINTAPPAGNATAPAQPGAIQPGNTAAMPVSSPGATVQQGQQPQNVTIQPAQTARPVSGAVNPAHGQPGHRCDIAVGAPLNSAPATTQAAVSPAQQPVVQQIKTPPVVQQAQPVVQKTAPGMNPPHGQPGHRCDIAVGAPLNSKPAATPAPVQVQPTLSAPPTPVKTDTAGKG